jgi:hypothetical protein
METEGSSHRKNVTNTNLSYGHIVNIFTHFFSGQDIKDHTFFRTGYHASHFFRDRLSRITLFSGQDIKDHTFFMKGYYGSHFFRDRISRITLFSGQVIKDHTFFWTGYQGSHFFHERILRITLFSGQDITDHTFFRKGYHGLHFFQGRISQNLNYFTDVHILILCRSSWNAKHFLQEFQKTAGIVSLTLQNIMVTMYTSYFTIEKLYILIREFITFHMT